MSFPDYDALVVESKPDVPGGEVRLSLLRRGAELERDRIVALLEKHGRSLRFGDDKTLLANVIKLIESDAE
jgi:hypothetical protein